MADIAYIDDNRDCLLVVQTAFKDIGLNVDIYDDPIQFYNKNVEYKLIISDFDMPNLNGQEFIQLVKEKMPKVKTIIYSGMMNEIKELNLEIDSFLFKPLEFDSLLKVVRFLLFEYDGENIKQA
ncbi:MAG: DNA-binding NtrC family response regulator [Bacteriovoracaceae bacterium]|jgi:DNA-binding NtrC family response regulator